MKTMYKDKVHKVINFTSREISNMYDGLKNYNETQSMQGRVKHFQFSLFDVFFMNLIVYKSGKSQEFVSCTFKINPCTFQRMTTKFVKLAGPNA